MKRRRIQLVVALLALLVSAALAWQLTDRVRTVEVVTLWGATMAAGVGIGLWAGRRSSD